MLLVGALFLVSAQGYSQKDVLELLPGSKTMEFDEFTGVYRLIGNVNFLYQGNKMYCDSAHYNRKKNTVRAYGNVHINKRDTLNLFCDSLFYEGNKRAAKLWGNVRVRDNEYKLTTDTLEYDARKSQAVYRHGGKVESILTKEILTSKIGYFYPESKNFFFSKHVRYQGEEMSMETDTLNYVYSQKRTNFYGPTYIHTRDAEMYCEKGWYQTISGEGTLISNASISRKTDYISGDTLIYSPSLKQSIGKGNVYYLDSAQNMAFHSDYAFSSDSLSYSLLTGNAIATKHMDSDTLHLHADTLYLVQQDSSQLLKAYHGAASYSSSMQSRADSIVYNEAAGKMEFHYTPIIWSKGAELKGEFMTMSLNDTVIEHIEIINKASILMEIEPELYYNQISGKTILATFIDNDLKKAHVNGNAITLFYPEEEEKTDTLLTKKRMGMNRLYASHLRIDLDSNEIVGITYIDQPDGVFYPMEKIKESEQFIPGFDWKYALRPENREDLLAD